MSDHPETSTATGKSVKKNRRTKKNMKQIADESINKTGTPLPISTIWSGFTPETHGNVEVDLDPELPERFSAKLSTNINGVTRMTYTAMPWNSNHGRMHDSAPRAYHHIAAGCNLAMALKLIHSTPSSQRGYIDDLKHFDDREVCVPTSFNPLLNLIGKTDFEKSSIRIKDNPTLIQHLFLKAVWHETFIGSFSNYIDEDDDLYDKIVDFHNVKDDDLQHIIFDDPISLRLLKEKGNSMLQDLLNIGRRVTLEGGEELVVRARPFEGIVTIRNLVAWLNYIHASPFEGKEQIYLLSMVASFRTKWFDSYEDTFETIDAKFANTPVANNTPLQLFERVGLRYYKQYFEDMNGFKKCVNYALEAYTNDLPILTQFMKVTEMSRSQFGSPAQLVVIADNDTENFYHKKLVNHLTDLKIPVPEASTIFCQRNVNLPGPVVLAASYMITKEVKYRESFRSFTNVALLDFINRNVNDSVDFHRNKV